MGAGGCSKGGGSARETRAVTALKSPAHRAAQAPGMAGCAPASGDAPHAIFP